MAQDLKILLLGELRIVSQGEDVALPASRKARALLAFLVATGRPHRRERLCELFWGMPDDPKAALRWALSKLRAVVDTPGQPRIFADRERVYVDVDGIDIDIRSIHKKLRQSDGHFAVEELEGMAQQLDMLLLDGLDGVGDETFQFWLTSEREDAGVARVEVLQRLAMHPKATPISKEKWARLWRAADPLGVKAHERASPTATTADPRGAVVPRGRGGGTQLSTRTDDRVRARTPGARARALRAQRIGFCEVRDGTKIAYATVGLGPPMLKAANWLNHLEFDWGSPIWGRSFATIARYRSFIRYDERGCGLSDWDVEDLSFEAFVEDLEAVVDRLGLDRFPLLGISQGCAVSIEYAVRHPERVTGLVLISGYAAGWRLLASPDEQDRREAVMKLTEVGWGTNNPAYRHIFSQTFMPEASANDLAWFDEFQRLTTSPINAARFQEAFGRIDVRHRLAQVKAPTIVLHSMHDQRIPLDQGRAVAAGIPGAHFVPLESRNHILIDHEPAWRVCVETVAQFMAEKGI
ncbi:alpha/beta hydrolase fold containing protein [Rhizobium sp. PDO1-076]|uniref:alpha/beta hydrolase n=1 Tax=Rhizobium sp. PDO1-076 TaxID=1125979 RepID=UPI00024E296A|nr:alpha/beta hydrolase [Rhizobium sp. PDO1-076]EHS51779.1 alpha/beta hydrolase fold containing protein [Rhizobium sp. PDO1-076]